HPEHRGRARTARAGATRRVREEPRGLPGASERGDGPLDPDARAGQGRQGRRVSSAVDLRPEPIRPRPGGDARGSARDSGVAGTSDARHPSDEGGADQGAHRRTVERREAGDPRRGRGRRQGRRARVDGGRRQGHRFVHRGPRPQRQRAGAGLALGPREPPMLGDLLTLLWAPFVMCLVLTGIHAYLGVHVLAREVVFVDIALAQIAALGATAAFLFGYEMDTWESYASGLSATILGALVLALTRSRRRHVSQEAVIGVVYAVSAAAAVLVADRA